MEWIDFIPPLSFEETENWIREHGPEGLLPVKWVEYFNRLKIPVTASLLKQYKVKILGGMEWTEPRSAVAAL